jgi:SAM-dependent methyltransferase
MAPHHSFQGVLADGRNPFERFRHLSVPEWTALLQRSIHEPVIDEVEFPRFPEEALQETIHGNSAEQGIGEAASFYESCLRYYVPGEGQRFLDFGAGWGRMTRLFMRDFAADGLFGFEPDLRFCAIARALNPYVCFMHGPRHPRDTLPRDFFDVIVGYSVFSHLPEYLARNWLSELAGALRPHGVCIVTTYGERWLKMVEDQVAADNPHWHVARLLTATSIDEIAERYNAGEFVAEGGDSDFRTAALIPHGYIHRMIDGLPLELVDIAIGAQDSFVLRRS